MKNIIYTIFLFLCTISYCQTTPIQNTNFEKTLIDLGIDSDGTVNGQVLSNDIAQVTHLDLSTSNHLPIYNLDTWYDSHLEGLTSLKVLNISGIGYENILDEKPWLDLSHLTNLEELYISSESQHPNSIFNNIENIYLRNNPNLTIIESTSTGNLSAIDLKGTDTNNPNLIISFSGSSNDQNCCSDICINVTNPNDAQNGQGLYANWSVSYTNNTNNTFSYSSACNFGSIDVDTDRWVKTFFYPNPVKEQLHIESNLSIAKAYLYDITGKQIKTYRSNQLSQPIDMSSLHSGVYFINLYSDSGQQTTKKIIIE